MTATDPFEEIERLKASARSTMAAILDTIGGTVDGQPTSEINYLRRLRQLVEIERASKFEHGADWIYPSSSWRAP